MDDDATERRDTRVRQWIHWIAVLLVLTMIPTGLAMADTLDVTTARTGHQVSAYPFVALLVLHVAGIVRHHVRQGAALAPMLRARR